MSKTSQKFLMSKSQVADHWAAAIQQKLKGKVPKAVAEEVGREIFESLSGYPIGAYLSQADWQTLKKKMEPEVNDAVNFVIEHWADELDEETRLQLLAADDEIQPEVGD